MRTALSSLGERVAYLKGDRVREDLQVSLWIHYPCMQRATYLWELQRKKSCDLVLWVPSAVLYRQRKFRSTTYYYTTFRLWGLHQNTTLGLFGYLGGFSQLSQGSQVSFLLQWSQLLGFVPPNTCTAPPIWLQVHVVSSGVPSLFCIKGNRCPWKWCFIAKHCWETAKGSTSKGPMREDCKPPLKAGEALLHTEGFPAGPSFTMTGRILALASEI